VRRRQAGKKKNPRSIDLSARAETNNSAHVSARADGRTVFVSAGRSSGSSLPPPN
jgi:hypothetical protein